MATPITYISSITGDCSNLGQGAISVDIMGGTPPYTIDWLTPNLGADVGVITSTRTGLTAGLYVIEVTDSTLPDNQVVQINLFVSDGLCVTIIDEQNANCGGQTGSLTAYATSTTNIVSYDLYQYDPITGTSILIATSPNNIFLGLGPGVYYIVACDEGGCTGSTASCIINGGNNFEFGLYVIQPSSCLSGTTGAIYVTGLTGTPPYSYVWSNAQTSSYITGLTSDFYSVTVTDGSGCSISKSIFLDNATTLSIVNYTNTPPTCFNSDGEIIVNISGGTPPYYYQFSDGHSEISFLTSLVYSGIPSGQYTVTVTDAALCVVSGTTVLSTPGSFTSVEVSTTNATCNNQNGSIFVNVIGGGGSVQIEMTRPDLSYSTVNSSSHIFNGLTPGIYTIVISNGGPCVYQEIVQINDDTVFTVSTVVNNAYCGLNNGSITITLSAIGEYIYQIDSSVSAISATTNYFTFTVFNLYPGYHTLYVDKIDITGSCIVEIPFLIESTTKPELLLSTTSCGSGSEGTITALISGGIPPFTFLWSSNVGGQTGVYVTGLTADVYSLTITDSVGCEITQTATVTCRKPRTRPTDTTGVTYTLFTVCESTFTEEPGGQLGIFEMFYDGYLSLLSGDTNCEVTNATYTILVIVDGVAYSVTFYNSTGPTDIPSDFEYITALQNLLSTIPGLGAIIFDEETNTFILNSDCEQTPKHITIKLKIDYRICCRIEKDPDLVCFKVNYLDVSVYQYYSSLSSGQYNGYNYYKIYYSGTLVGYVFYSLINNRWEFWSTLGETGTLYSYLNNGLEYPISNGTGDDWVVVGSGFYSITESGDICSNLITTTTTLSSTTTTTTFTGTSTTTTFTGTSTTTTSSATTTTTTFTGTSTTTTTFTGTSTTTTTTISGLCYCYTVVYVEATTTTTTFADCHCLVVTYNAPPTTTTTTSPPTTTTTTTISGLCYCYTVIYVEATTTTTTFADCHCIIVTYNATTTTTTSPTTTTTTSPTTTTTTFSDCHCLVVTYNAPTTTTTTFTGTTTTTTTISGLCYCFTVLFIEETTTTTTTSCNCYAFMYVLETTTTTQPTTTTTQPTTTTTSSGTTTTTTQPTTTTTSSGTTTTTTCPCYSGSVTINQSILNIATGNTISGYDNGVYMDFTFCNKEGLLVRYDLAGVYQECFDSRYIGGTLVYYYQNDIQIFINPLPVVYYPTVCCVVTTQPASCDCWAVQNNNFEPCVVYYQDCSLQNTSQFIPGSGVTTYICAYGIPSPDALDTACVNDIISINTGPCLFGQCTGITTTIPITYYEWNIVTCTPALCQGGLCSCQSPSNTIIYTDSSINTLNGVYTAGPGQLFVDPLLTQPYAPSPFVAYIQNPNFPFTIYQYTELGGSVFFCDITSPCLP